MVRFIKDILSRINSPQRGYVYVERDDPGVMTAAKPGARAQIPGRSPPWIVVNHDLAVVTVARWPGSLWYVEVVDPITPEEQKDSPLRADAGYTRAAAVKVLKQVAVGELFGAHGSKVCTVINAAGELTLETAGRLAESRHAHASEAASRLWRAWIARHQVLFAGYRGDFDGVISVGRPRSPIGVALGVVSAQVGRRAEAVAGKSVWIDVPDDPEEVYLAKPWSGAQHPLFDAALAVGAPEFVSAADRSILLEGWRSVFGDDPA